MKAALGVPSELTAALGDSLSLGFVMRFFAGRPGGGGGGEEGGGLRAFAAVKRGRRLFGRGWERRLVELAGPQLLLYPGEADRDQLM